MKVEFSRKILEKYSYHYLHMPLLDSCLQTCMTYTTAECTVNKLLMMDRRPVRNMQSFMTKYICEISAASWFYYKVICYDARSHERKIQFDLIQVELITCRTAMSGIANRQLRRSVLKMKRVAICMTFVFHTVHILVGLNELEPF